MGRNDTEKEEIRASIEEIGLTVEDMLLDLYCPGWWADTRTSIRKIERELTSIKRTMERGCNI